MNEVLLAALQSKPVAYPPRVPSELAALANQATAADVAQRPASAAAFREALDEYERHRSSTMLSKAADALLEPIEAAVTKELPQGDPALSRWIYECRFAYQQALREWPENPDALGGLQRCLEATTRHELRCRNAAGARAALAELPAPNPDLAAEVTRLEETLRAEDEERSRLRAMAHEIDSRLAPGPRAALVAGVCVIGVLATTITVYLNTTTRITVRDGVDAAAMFLLAVLAPIVGGHRRLLVNAFNRRLAGWFVLLNVAVLCNRATGLYVGSTLDDVLLTDFVIASALLATGGLLLFRWLWILAAVFVVGGLGALRFPMASPSILVASMMCGLCIALFFFLRRRPNAPPDDRQSSWSLK